MITQTHQQVTPGWTFPDTFDITTEAVGVDITVFWTPLSDLFYDIYRSIDGIEFSLVASDLETDSQTVTGQLSETTYYFYVIASNSSSGLSSQSATSIVTTFKILQTPTLVFTSSTISSLSFSWDTIPEAVSYTFSYSTNPALLGTASAFTTTVINATFGNPALSFLIDSTTFYVVIRANASDPTLNSVWSNVVTAFTLRPLPAIPSGFAATPSINGIVLTWSDVPTEMGYRLYRSTINNQTSALLLIELPEDTITFTDTTVYSDTLYYYWLQSYQFYGDPLNIHEESSFTATSATAYHIPLLEVIPFSSSQPVVIDNNLTTYVEFTASEYGSESITFSFKNPEFISKIGLLIQTDAYDSQVTCQCTTPLGAVYTSYHSINEGSTFNLDTLNEDSAFQLSFWIDGSYAYAIPVHSITLIFSYSGSIPCSFSVFEAKFYGYPSSEFQGTINTIRTDTQLAYTFQDILPSHVEFGHFEKAPLSLVISASTYTRTGDFTYTVVLSLASDALQMARYSTLTEAISKIDTILPSFNSAVTLTGVSLGAEYFFLLQNGLRYSIYKYIANLNRPKELILVESRNDTSTPIFTDMRETFLENPVIFDSLLPDTHYFLRFSDQHLNSFP